MKLWWLECRNKRSDPLWEGPASHQLVGKVKAYQGEDGFSEEGEWLGNIEGIFSTGSNDVYVCTGGAREILIPAIDEVVRKVDVEKRTLVVHLLEGL